MTKWYHASEENKEIQKQKNRDRYLADPEKERAYRRASYHKNKNKPEKVQYHLWKHAKHRSVMFNLPFTIEPSDIIIPEVCPYFGEPIGGVGSGQFSASVDQKIPKLGYTKENIQVISTLANRMKYNATREQLVAFAKGILALEGGNALC